MKKHGKNSGKQRYKCLDCLRTYSHTNYLQSAQIWHDYTVGKQTYKQLALTYDCSVRTIQRHLKKAPKTPLSTPQTTMLNLIMDVTFFGRQFGVLVIMDSRSKKVIYHQIVRTEKDIYYTKAINRLRKKGFIIQSITCDGRRGLLKDIFNTPTQMCQFHLVAMVIRKLTRNPKSVAGKELKTMVKTLKQSHKNDFYVRLHHWFLQHKAYLEERSDIPDNQGKFPYKHRKLRGAYASIKRYMDYLFVFEKYPELRIEKTTNRLEGLFKDLKQKLSVHNGLNRRNKIMFIQDFLSKKS
ncbi:IS256 family transposase, variant Zn-binding type [Testudinibacter sp. P27/CKL/0425]